jgi:hypothetical protein
MKKIELKQLIKEEIKKILGEAQSPSYKSQHKTNNLVATFYFSWNDNDNNKPIFMDRNNQDYRRK